MGYNGTTNVRIKSTEVSMNHKSESSIPIYSDALSPESVGSKSD